MKQRGIRGAITIDENTVESIISGVEELINEIRTQNEFKEEDISFVIFTMTEDLDCMYPAKALRDKFPSWSRVPFMCHQELKIINSLEKSLRVLIVINTDLEQNEINHVYLKGARKLRVDLVR